MISDRACNQFYSRTSAGIPRGILHWAVAVGLLVSVSAAQSKDIVGNSRSPSDPRTRGDLLEPSGDASFHTEAPAPSPGFCWEWAERNSSAQAYRCFVYHFPEDARAEKAKARWEELDLLETRQLAMRDPSRAVSVYGRFLRRHPGSECRKQVPKAYRESPLVEIETSEDGDPALSLRIRSVLLDAIRDPDSRVREYAADAWALIGDGKSVTDLVELLNDPSSEVRCGAVSALGRIGEPETVSNILEMLADPEWDVRYRAARALGILGDPSAADGLIAALGDPDGRVRKGAVDALGMIDDPYVAPRLIAAVDGAPRIARASAVAALGRMGDPAALECIKAAAESRNASIRRAAVEALGDIGDPRSGELLLRILFDDPDDVVSRQAGCSLGRTAGGDAVGRLAGALADGDTNVRKRAVYTLGKITDPRATVPLLTALQDPAWQVRMEAAEALGTLRDPRAVKELVVALGDPNWWVRMEAAEALGKIGDPAAVDALLGALDDGKLMVRVNAARALSEIGEPRGVEPLAGMLADHNAYARRQAVAVLPVLGREDAFPTLIGALKDEDRGVRDAAIESLADLCLRTNPAGLSAALQDPDARVRQGTAAALARVTREEWSLLFDPGEPASPIVKDILSRLGAMHDPSNAETVSELTDIVRDTTRRSIREQSRLIAGLAGLVNEDPECIRDFMRALRSTTGCGMIHLEVTRELARLKDPEATGDLGSYAESNDPAKAACAAELLAFREDAGIPPSLVSSLENEDGAVRVYAAGAILEILERSGPRLQASWSSEAG